MLILVVFLESHDVPMNQFFVNGYLALHFILGFLILARLFINYLAGKLLPTLFLLNFIALSKATLLLYQFVPCQIASSVYTYASYYRRSSIKVYTLHLI